MYAYKSVFVYVCAIMSNLCISCCIILFLAGVDFVPFDMVITFSPGSNTMCVDIQPIPDSTTEGSESFPLVLTSTDPDVQTGPQSEVEIIDRNSEFWCMA